VTGNGVSRQAAEKFFVRLYQQTNKTNFQIFRIELRGFEPVAKVIGISRNFAP
jgi:hypothetical protein